MKKATEATLEKKRFSILRQAFETFWSAVSNPRRRTLWHWDMTDAGNKAVFGDLSAAARGAAVLGYDTHIEHTDNFTKLQVVFVKKTPGKPWELVVSHYK